MIGPHTRLRESDELFLSRTKPHSKSRHFFYLRALITRKILRSKEAQCNTGQ